MNHGTKIICSVSVSLLLALLLPISSVQAQGNGNGNGHGNGNSGGGGGGTALEYDIYQLNSGDGAFSGFAADLNDVGGIVGQVVNNVTGDVHPACWQITVAADETVTSELNLLPGISNAHATAVSNHGQIAGDAVLGGVWRGIYWPSANDEPLELPPLSGDAESRTFGINDAGVICGVSRGTDDHPVVWRVTNDNNGNTTILGPFALPAPNGIAWDLTETDGAGAVTIAGNAWDFQSSAAVTWRIELQSDGGVLVDSAVSTVRDDVNAYGINNTGIVCGDSSRPDWRATLWTNTDEITLDLPRRYKSSAALDLNDSGVTVGWVSDQIRYPGTAAIWSGAGTNQSY